MTEEEKKEEAKNKLEIPKELTDTLASMGEVLGSLGTTMTTMQKSLADLEKEKGKDPDDKNKKKVTFDNLESLDRRQYMDVIIGQIKDVIGDQLKPLSEDISGVKKSRSDKMIVDSLSKARKDHKDFDDWKTEIIALADNNPMLTPDEAYILARNSDPKKSKEMDEKHMSEEDKDKLSKDKDKTFFGDEADIAEQFGGLTPTSGKVESSEEVDDDTAAETAWRRTFGSANTPT